VIGDEVVTGVIGTGGLLKFGVPATRSTLLRGLKD
jgi:hypothetical protein